MQVSRESANLCRQLVFSLMVKRLVVEHGDGSRMLKERRRARQTVGPLSKVVWSIDVNFTSAIQSMSLRALFPATSIPAFGSGDFQVSPLMCL